MFRYISFFVSLFLFLNCNFIPASVPGASITGKDVKKEIKKVRENVGFLSTISLFGLGSSSTTSFTNTLKTCPNFTTDTEAPSFKLPEPSAFSNVNITGSVSSSTSQLWSSEPVTATSSINISQVSSSSVLCRYSVNSVPTTTTGTLLSSSFGTSVTISTVGSVLNIICYTTSTSSLTYSISLNPRASSSTTSFSSSLTSLFSIETLAPDEVFARVANIQDDEVYTYDSFEKCKANYTRWVGASILANSQALTNFTNCGSLNFPPNQVYLQGLTCNLEKAGLVEF